MGGQILKEQLASAPEASVTIGQCLTTRRRLSRGTCKTRIFHQHPSATTQVGVPTQTSLRRQPTSWWSQDSLCPEYLVQAAPRPQLLVSFRCSTTFAFRMVSQP